MLCQNASKVSHDICYLSPQVQKRYDYVTKISRNSLKVRFRFQTGYKIVIYVSIRRRWDCTTLQHYCALFRSSSGWYNLTPGYTEVFQGGTISPRPIQKCLRVVQSHLRLYRSTSGWYNLTPGYTEVFQGGTISPRPIQKCLRVVQSHLRLYRSTSVWYNLTPGYTEVLQGGTISILTGRHVYNWMHTLNLGCSFITLREPCINQRPICDIGWLHVTNHFTTIFLVKWLSNQRTVVYIFNVLNKYITISYIFFRH